MKLIPFLLLLAIATVGCRQESWKTVEFPCPPNCSHAEIAERLISLDRQTPPEVEFVANHVRIRYNALRIAPRNFSYQLEQLAAEKETP